MSPVRSHLVMIYKQNFKNNTVVDFNLETLISYANPF